MSLTFKLPPRILRPKSLQSGSQPHPPNQYFEPVIQSQHSAIKGLKKCQICNELQPESEFFCYFMCSHQFCRECLRSYLSRIFEDRTRISVYPITCPNQGCSQKLNQYSRFKNMNDDWRYRYSRDRRHKTVPCPGVDCPDILWKLPSKPLYCRRENKYFCAECRETQHSGQCEFEVQKQILRQYNNYTMCPQCKTVIQIVQGCNHVICNCGKQFCFNCNGPKHEGKCLKSNMKLSESETSFFDWTGFALPYLSIFCAIIFLLCSPIAFIVCICQGLITVIKTIVRYRSCNCEWIVLFIVLMIPILIVLIASIWWGIYGWVLWIKQYWLVTWNRIIGREYYRSSIDWVRWYRELTIESDVFRFG